MIEKLDWFSKTLLATSTINFMASTLNTINEECKVALIPENRILEDNGLSRKILEELVGDQDKKLEELVDELAAIVKNLGTYLHNKDAVCAIDARIYKAPSEILLQRKDEVDDTYNDESIWALPFNV